MINGMLNNIKHYKGISSNLDTAIDYILCNNLNSLNNGKTIIDGDNVFLNKFTYTSLPESECCFEGHKKYLDIHLILSGEELIAYSDISNLTPITDYDIENDFQLFHGDITNYYKITPNTFVMTFLEDIHMPKISSKKRSIVDKVVVKVLL
ncbi:MAG: YhcH/YjgK/YiaL family protein [Sarcina sp.]